MTTLASLASELGMSPSELRSFILGKDEALQPNYFTVNAAGQVSAVFPGGLQIPADLNAGFNFTPSRTVRWVDQNGAAIAIIDGITTSPANQNQLLLESLGTFFGPGTQYNAYMQFMASISGLSSFIATGVFGPGGGNQKTLLRDDGGSAFVSWAHGGGNSVQTRGAGLYSTFQYALGPFTAGVTMTFPNMPIGWFTSVHVASGYRNAPPGMGFLDCYYNGGSIGGPQLFFNNLEHLVFPTMMFGLGYNSIANSTVTLSLATNPANGTNSDANDWCMMGFIVT